MNINRLFKIVTVVFITSSVLALVFGVIALVSDLKEKNKGDGDGKQTVVSEVSEKTSTVKEDEELNGSKDVTSAKTDSSKTLASDDKKENDSKKNDKTEPSDGQAETVKTDTTAKPGDSGNPGQEGSATGTADTPTVTSDGLPIGQSVPKENLKFDGTETHFVLQNIETSVNVRKEADSSSDKVGVLLKGAYGVLIEKGEDFSLVKCGDVSGYILNTYLMIGRAADEQIQGVSTRRVKIDRAVFIRDDANMESNKLAIAAEGSVYSVDPTAPEVHGWVAIVYNDAPKAYVSASFCTVE